MVGAKLTMWPFRISDLVDVAKELIHKVTGLVEVIDFDLLRGDPLGGIPQLRKDLHPLHDR